MYASSSTVRRIPKFVVLTVVLFVAVAPVYWLITLATQTNGHIVSAHPNLFPSLTRFGGLSQTNVPLWSWIRNSAIVGIGTAILGVTLGVFTGYGFSRFRFRGAGFFGFLVFATQMLPGALLVVPLYAIFSQAHLINNLLSLVLVNTAFSMPIAVWVIKSSVDGIPVELDEAAKVDGASRFGILMKVIVPLIAPGLAAAAIITFLAGWNDFLFANTFMISTGHWTATKGLASFFGQYSVPINLIMATATLFSIPPVVFFIILQRRIVSGMTAGAVKG